MSIHKPGSGPRAHHLRQARRTEAPAETPQPATAAQGAVPSPAVQPDWTARLVDPQQRADSRRRAGAQVGNLSAEAAREANETAEREAIGGRNEPGRLMDMGGDPSRGTVVTIHGINDNPASVLPLASRAERTGASHQTFAWDDRSRRLGDSANDFKREIAALVERTPPGQPLVINAYSMGGRVAAVGLARAQNEGLLQGRRVELNLVAPPLQGFSSANMAGMGALFAPSLRSSVDMGTRSDFQREIEGIRFAPNIRVSVYGGADDPVATPDADWHRVARGLAGDRVHVVEGRDHDTMIAEGGRLLR